MTVPNTNTDVTYLGDGATMRFPITFSFDKKEDVYVMRVDAEGREHLLTQDYFIDTASGNADVLYPGYPPGEEPPESERPPVLPDGEKLFIFRDTPHTQEQPFPDSGIIGNVRKAVDKLTMMIQELTTDIGHAIVFPQSSRFEGQLPAPVQPNSSIMTNSDGTGLKYGGDADKAQSDAEYAVDKVNELEKLIDGARIGDAKTLEGETGAEIKAEAVENALEEVAFDYYNKDEVDSKVVGIYRFKGSVAAYDDLPTTGQQVGDVWDVLDTGNNYAWTGTEWDNLGGISFGGGKEIGEIFPWPFESMPPVGSLYLDTIIRRREDYSELWSKASQEPQLKTDEEYLAMINEYGFCPYFSSGDGVDTFRTPSQPPYISGDYRGEGIKYYDDAIRDFVGDTGIESNSSAPPTGAFKVSDTTRYGVVFSTLNTIKTVVLDPSLVVPTADENRPKTFAYPWYIKAYGTVTNPNDINLTKLTELINYLANSVGEYIWYPGGGDADNPGTVAKNTAYERPNPFPGCPVHCIAEVLRDGKWGRNDLFAYNAGTAASHMMPSDTIVLQVGQDYVSPDSPRSGNGFQVAQGQQIETPLPARVRIYKLKSPTNPVPEINIGLSDAPNDGNEYVRKGKEWVQASEVGTGVPDAPNDGKAYIRKNNEWIEAPNDFTPIGSLAYSFGKNPPSGYLLTLGAEWSRDTYPALWAWAQENDLVITEIEWQQVKASQSSVGFFSDGDGLTTFRMPYIVDILRPVDSVNGDRRLGDYQGDAVGQIEVMRSKYSSSSAVTGLAAASAKNGLVGGLGTDFGYDYSQYLGTTNSVLARGVKNAEENRMANIAVNLCIKAYDTVTNEENIDVKNLQKEVDKNSTAIAGVQNELQAGQLVKASVRFNAYGGTITILKYFNVAYVTRNAVGDYTITFLKPMEDVNYCVAGLAASGNGRWLSLYNGAYNSFTPGIRDISSFRIAFHVGTTPTDVDDINIIVV